MRLICTLSGHEADSLPHFSFYLLSKGIENHIEEIPSSIGKPPTYKLWITEEDQVADALLLYEEYKKNPTHKRYKHKVLSPTTQKEDLSLSEKKPLFATRSFGPLTMAILCSVILLFLWSHVVREREFVPPAIKGVIQAPLLSPIEKSLLYDYPYYFQLRDQLFTLWPIEKIKARVLPSPEAEAVIQELQETKVWMGVYDLVLAHRKNPALYEQKKGAPLFEKISQGEFWRLVTPMLLHLDLLHIFFNVLWFIILSNQIESRIGSFRTLLLILFTAIPSNTAQYLMSGSFFMGLSGVICGMAAFIWVREQIAPWEGYLVHRFTLIFLGLFVLGMFLLSTLFFILQYFQGMELSAVIANSAHIVGAIAGYLLARTRLFASHL